MRFFERLYRSPFGYVMSLAANGFAKIQKPYMVYGYYDISTKRFRKYTRMSSTVTIMNRKGLSIGDDVWVWHHTILDATENITIEEGVQIGAWVGIFTHGSEKAVRLLGKQFVHIPNTERKGYTRGKVSIGAFTFIGAGSVILPGVEIGKGCLIGTGTLVTKSVPDYSIVVGSPGQVKGSTIDFDKKSFDHHDFSETYYDSEALLLLKEKMNK